MFIIGVIANTLHAKQIKKEIEQTLKAEVILINSRSIENIRNVKFEIIILQNLAENLKEKIEDIKEVLKNAKYLLLNSDTNMENNLFEKTNAKILTYGLKQKSTITISKIEENPAIISIQRGFENLNGDVIEQQEIPVHQEQKGTNYIYNLLIKTVIINIYNPKTC